MLLSREQDFPQWQAWGAMLGGWVMIDQGHSVEGMRQMRLGLSTFDNLGAALGRPYWLALLAEAVGKVGQVEEGLCLLAEAVETSQHSGEHRWEAELYRLQGELLLALKSAHDDEAEASFHQSLTIARRQQAKSLELRTAISLSRLWQRWGKGSEARLLLREAYDFFTEGFDTADLQEAKALLGQLS